MKSNNTVLSTIVNSDHEHIQISMKDKIKLQPTSIKHVYNNFSSTYYPLLVFYCLVFKEKLQAESF